jgi:membrane-associated phospholipid phosphatase
VSSWRPTLRTMGSTVLGVVGAAAAVDSARRARRGQVGATEERIFRWFNDRTDGIAPPVWTVMQSGSLGAVFVASGIVARRTDRHRAVLVSVLGTSVWLAAKAVKPLVGRGRPAEYLADVEVRGSAQSGLGYPSGHAALVLAIGLMLPAALKRSATPVDRVAAVALGGATGAARMYVGAHLPLDVVGGLALGAGVGSVGSRLLQRR